MTITKRMTFFLNESDDWDTREIALLQHIGAPSTTGGNYTENTWILSKPPGESRYYASKCVRVSECLHARMLTELLKQIEPSIIFWPRVAWKTQYDGRFVEISHEEM